MRMFFKKTRPGFFILASWLVASSSCKSPLANDAIIDRTFENGVEIINNHLDPYVLQGEPTDFRLEEELSIDFGSPEIGELGIADAMSFEVDQKGQIYFFYSHKKGDKIFKFGPDGKFMGSWGKHGQGPGDVMFISSACLTEQGKLIISDHSSRKIIWYSDKGILEKEVKYPVDGRYYMIVPANQTTFIGFARIITDQNADHFDFFFSLLDDDFKELKKLDVYKYPNPLIKPQRGINQNEFFCAKATPNHLFIGNEDRGYEILKFDMSGNLLMKIRKVYAPVKVPDDVLMKRKAYYAKSEQPYYYPEYYLPICDFFADDVGRLFVMTFEKRDNFHERVFDIFNTDGVLIRRKALNILSGGDIFVLAKSTRGRLYCFQEKGDGFNIFKVYRIIWE